MGESSSSSSWQRRNYECMFCKRGFTSSQALGGHMNVHRRDRAALHQSDALHDADITPMSNSNINILLGQQRYNEGASSHLSSYIVGMAHSSLTAAAWVMGDSFRDRSSISRISKSHQNESERANSKSVGELDASEKRDGGLDLELRLGKRH